MIQSFCRRPRRSDSPVCAIAALVLTIGVVGCGSDTTTVVVDTDDSGCKSPIPLGLGTLELDTRDGGHAVQGSCDTSEGEGPALAFELAVDVPIDLTIRVEGVDVILALYPDSACDPAAELVCRDTPGPVEELSINNLPAGAYYLVVSTFIGRTARDSEQLEGGPIELTVEARPQACDPTEAFSTPGTAALAGFGPINTAQQDLCPGETDYVLFGHMGGRLAVDVTALEPSPAPEFTIYHAIPDPDEPTQLIPGEVVTTSAYNAITDRGWFFLELTGDAAAGETQFSYRIQHGCAGDGRDDPTIARDDRGGDLAPWLPLDPWPFKRSVCGDDVDETFVIHFDPQPLSLQVMGDPLPAIALEHMAGFTADAPRVPLLLDVDYSETAIDGGVELTIAAATPGFYIVIATDPDPEAAEPVDLPYTLTYTVPSATPPNDFCEDATLLGATPTEIVPLLGRTRDGSNSMVHQCRLDDVPLNPETDGAGYEVFYRISLPEATHLQLDFDGRLSGFSGEVTLLAPEPLCPQSYLEHEIVLANNAPVCGAGQRFRLRAPDLPAGEYIVIVEGIRDDDHPSGDGIFSLAASTWPAEFAPPAACTEAIDVSLPAAGESLTLSVNTLWELDELSTYSACSDGGSGPERVLRFVPTEDLTLTATALGFDTILALSATCDTDTLIACSDDSEEVGDLGSQITATVLQGTPYFLIVDGWSAHDTGTAEITLSAQ